MHLSVKWAKNGKHRAEALGLLQATSETKGIHGLRLTLAGSLDLHAAVDIFDRFHCSLLVSKEKKKILPSPQTSARSVVERTDLTALRSVHNGFTIIKSRQTIFVSSAQQTGKEH